jgi:hypothetical protein
MILTQALVLYQLTGSQNNLTNDTSSYLPSYSEQALQIWLGEKMTLDGARAAKYRL